MLTFFFATVVALVVAGGLGYLLTVRAEDAFLRARERRAAKLAAAQEGEAGATPLVRGGVSLDH